MEKTKDSYVIIARKFNGKITLFSRRIQKLLDVNMKNFNKYYKNNTENF